MRTLTYDDGLLVCGDNLEWMCQQPDNSIDLTFGSPPYENARTYGIDFDLTGQDWVDWMMERWIEMHRITKGLVAMVIEGTQEDYEWSATAILLAAGLKRKGYKLRKPVLHERPGIPGSQTPDFLRNLYEFIIVTSKGKLPWSDPTVTGKPSKDDYISKEDRQRINDLMATEKITQRDAVRKLGIAFRVDKIGRTKDGTEYEVPYVPPERANPGNIVHCTGYMGSDKASANEAAFPEKLADFFVRSFCPKDGVVLDPFNGGGTTVSTARKRRRRFVGVDIRDSQIDLTVTRLEEAAYRRGFDLE